ncbi:hypothetical protein PAMP_021195 [Pampus punctatissimus]
MLAAWAQSQWTRMTWRPQYRSSKFRHVFGKAATKEGCYDGVPITRSVQDNNFCAVNPRFLAVITECAGGGAFLVLPVHHVMIWNLDCPEQVIKNPVRTISHHTDVVLSMSFNTDGSLLATTCKDRKVRLMEPRSGNLLQESNCKTHKASKVLILGNMKMLLTSGTSRWNDRQVALWDQDDLSVPLVQDNLDGSSGVLFPFYDPDTHMLYLAGKGDGNIRYYEISSEKPYIHYLTEYRSLLPQKGMGVMPKRGLDVSSCEVFRFYKLVTTKSLIEPLSMIVPRRPGSQVAESYSELNKGVGNSLDSRRSQSRPSMMQLAYIQDQLGSKDSKEDNGLTEDDRSWMPVSKGEDLALCSPPRTENELRLKFHKQQEEIRRLRELLNQRDVHIKQLELEIRNIKNTQP